jgi:hypothetical protein
MPWTARNKKNLQGPWSWCHRRPTYFWSKTWMSFLYFLGNRRNYYGFTVMVDTWHMTCDVTCDVTRGVTRDVTCDVTRDVTHRVTRGVTWHLTWYMTWYVIRDTWRCSYGNYDSYFSFYDVIKEKIWSDGLVVSALPIRSLTICRRVMSLPEFPWVDLLLLQLKPS